MARRSAAVNLELFAIASMGTTTGSTGLHGEMKEKNHRFARFIPVIARVPRGFSFRTHNRNPI
jgi:hypothetical protein